MAAEHLLLLDPALGVSSAELAAAWAAIPECAEAGKCQAGRGATNFSVDIGDAATIALITLSADVAKDLIVELVKSAIARARAKHEKKVSEEAVVEQVTDRATGLPLLRVGRRG